jgi:hypothetical protein
MSGSISVAAHDAHLGGGLIIGIAIAARLVPAPLDEERGRAKLLDKIEKAKTEYLEVPGEGSATYDYAVFGVSRYDGE